MPFRPESIAMPLLRLPLAVACAVHVAGCWSVSSIRTESLPDGTVGQPYSFALEDNCAGQSSSDITSWTLTGFLPEGIRFSGDGGRFSGTPTSAGAYSLTISLVTSSGGYIADTVRETRTYTLTIHQATATTSSETTSELPVRYTSRRTNGWS